MSIQAFDGSCAAALEVDTELARLAQLLHDLQGLFRGVERHAVDALDHVPPLQPHLGQQGARLDALDHEAVGLAVDQVRLQQRGAQLFADIRAGRLGGAAIDVLPQEPPVDGNPLLAHDIPNLIVTPHIAWAAREARQRCLEEMAANVEDFLRGGHQGRVV